MKKRFAFLLFFAISATAFTNLVFETKYYVSPTGSISAIGTISDPLNFTTAIAKSLTAGDSLIIRGGLYSFSGSQTISKSGSATLFYHIIAFPGEIPILDFRTQVYGSSSIGVKLSSNFVHFKGITVQGAGDNGLQVTGSNNFIENCTFRWNCDSGIQMKTGSNNYIFNCDSYENFDYQTGGTSAPDYGGNADGFADKQYTNTGTNTYKGCRSWKNSDDGWDSYEKIGNTVYDSCFCYANGPSTFDMTGNIRFKTDSATWFSKFKNAAGRYVITNYGNGNGFKLGGNYTANNATLHNCISVGNTVKGFDQNNNNGIMTIYNCTGYINKPDYGFSNSSYGTLIIKNCASLSSKSSNSLNCKSVTQSFNSWNSGFSCVTADFVSLDYAQMLNQRQSDGSLPEITFLHLTPTSGLLNKGTNVGFAYVGSAPDLGAFEYGVMTPVENIPIENEDIEIYCNADKNLTVNGKLANIEIYSLSGIKLYSQNCSSENTTIPVLNLSKNIYFVRVILKNGTSLTRKLLIY